MSNKTICVFGAASDTISPALLAGGETLGRTFAERDVTVLFGGGATGMMGAVARGVRAGGGKLIGIAPHFFDKPGILFSQCDTFVFTQTMRERKAEMEARSDGFLVLPGGIGTLEEFFEIFTLRQLEQHAKPIALWNAESFFTPLAALLDHLVATNMLTPEARALCHFFDTDETDAMLSFLTT